MTNFYFNLNQIQSNPDGQLTVKRQSRLTSNPGKMNKKEQLSRDCLRDASEMPLRCLRYLSRIAMIFCVLAMSVGQMWGETDYILGLFNVSGGNVALTKNSFGTNGALVYNGSSLSTTTAVSFKTSGGDAVTKGSIYYTTNTLTQANCTTATNAGTSSSDGYVRGFQIAVNSTYTLALGDVTATDIYIIGRFAKKQDASNVITIKNSSSETIGNISNNNSTGTNLTPNHFSGTFTGNITIQNTSTNSNDEYRALIYIIASDGGGGGGGCTSITPTWSTDYSSTTLNVGATSSIPVVGKDGSSGAVTFSSSDTDIATVNSSGVVTGVGAGTATITATVEADGGKCEGTVTKEFTIKAGVTYNANGADGGSVPTDASTYAYNTNITVAGNTGSLYKTGFVFNGWNTRSDGTGTHYEAGATMKMPSKSTGVTLYAEWVGYATSWEWWNSGQSNDGTTFTYLTNKNYICSFKSSASTAVASWDITGTIVYRGVKMKTKDHYMYFWVPTGKRVSITFGYMSTKPTFTVGGVNKAGDLTTSTTDSATVTYTTTADTKFYIENETATKTAFTVKSVKIEDDATCPSAYSFHYGPATGAWETPICFEKVGSTHEWNITNFAIPNHTNGQFYVGYAGSTNGQSVTKAWTESYSESDGVGNGAMLLLPTNGSVVGNAVGATGTLVIWDNSSSKNQYVGFKPDGYSIRYSGTDHVFTETATANKWETDVVTLPDVSTTYTMEIKTEDGYTTCYHSNASEAISAMGVTNVAGGKKAIYLVPGSFNVLGTEKYAIYDKTADAFSSDFMKDDDGDGIYVGYVSSGCTSIILVRMSADATTSELASKDWTHKWNQTKGSGIAISGDLAKKFTITSLDGDNCNYSTANMQPITGQKGKFRMWANSNDNNWYVHFIPYYVLSYDANGGSGTTAATERNSESSTLTVSVASNGFTAPTGYTFAGWATSDERADAGTVDYAAGASYTLTSNATLYAVWRPILVTAISVDPSSETLNVGGTVTLSATATPSTALDQTVTWSSDNTDVATVNESGVVTAVAPGSCTITATAHDGSGKTGTCSITVNKITPTKYSFSVDKTVLCGEETATLTLAGSQSGVTYELREDSSTPIAGTTKTGTSSALTWTGLGAGTYRPYAVADATYNEKEMGSNKIAISAGTTTSITTQPTNQEVTVGEEATLTIVAAGTNLSYQWQESATEDGTYTDVASDGTSASYSVTPAAAGTKWYKCVVTGDCGTATSNKVSIVAAAAATCAGDPTALVSGELYTIDEMVSNCSVTAISSTTSDGTGIFQYGLSSNGKFYVVGTTNGDNNSTGTVEMKKQGASTITVKDETFTYIAWFKGSGSTSCRSIKFVTPSAGTLIIYGKVADKKGNIELKQGSNSAVDVMANSKNGSDTVHVSITAGATCYIWADGGSAALYGLKFVAAVPCTAAPTVTAGSSSSVTSTTATVSCASGISVLGTGGCTISSYGFVIGTVTGPTIGGSGVTQHEVGTSYTTTGTSFSKDLTGLTAETTYYVRPYATNGFGTAYGTETSFTTTAAPTLYTVTFNSNGGSAQASITQASEDASIAMPSAPTYSGYTFQGWVIGGSTYAAGASYTPTANITAYASWKADCAGGGGGGSGATLFSQNFNSATAVAYEDRAGSKLSITSSSSNSIVGNTAASQFTTITADKKGSTGIAINSSAGGNSVDATGIFQAYYNNTGGYWSICKTSDFAATAPTAIKVSMKVWARVGSSSSAVMANFAVGDGFSDGLTSSSPGTSSVHSGFSITNESSMKFAAYNVYNTKIYNTALTQSSWMALTWVINNTGSALTYDDPNSSETTVNNDCYDLWMGTTLVAHNIAATTAAKDLQNLYIGSPSGKNHEIRLDDISVVDLSPAGSGCYYVTYNGNGAEAGSISDATAYTAGTSVTVSSNTGASAFTKSGYHVGSWNTAANGSGTTYALGATFNISADVTLYAQWVADACSAPSAPTISGTSIRTVGQTIELTAFCESGKDARTTYTWYKGETFAGAVQVQAPLTIEEGGRIFNKASCVAGDAGTYWCEASNGTGCESHNATGFAVTVNDAAGGEHIYYYKDANHYSDGVYSDPEGNTATLKDNQNLSSPWMICNGCMTGVDSVVAHGATYDGKGNHMNAYIKLPTGGDATTKNIKFALTTGYTGTLTMKIGGYENNPTVTLQPLTAGVLGSAITPTSGTVGGVATTEDNFNPIVWPLSTAGGTYVLTVTSKTGYISQIDMTTSTSATFNVTYNGNGNTGGTVPTDATNYASGATVTVAANTGDGKLVKENYTGAGWNTANNGTGTNYVPGSGTFTITANTTLYAHWTQLITLAPGAQGTGTNNAAVSWNGSVLRGFAAHTASGYALQGYYTEPTGGTKVLNADGSFAATNIDGFVTSGKWSNTAAAPTLYAQWEASNLLKWNLKVNVSETSITTLSKESAAPTVIAVANMGNLTNNGSLTITGSAKSALTSKIATTASATGDDAGKYMSVQFIVAAGYQLVPSDIKVKVQPISHSQTTKLILEDNNSQSISYTSGSLSKGSTHTVTMTNSEEVAFTGTVTLKIYVYGTAESDGYRLGTPIEINGSVEATCTPPTFSGISYSATEYTVGASASAISVTGAANVDSYQWKYNTVNDRTSGTDCGTGASVTPSTESTGTLYYWCELTNACTTVKTAAVGITVRNATTDPTVTWSNVKLGATDDVTPNYGGGNYVLRATVNETSWPGTLAASMITTPAGITIHHVTTGTDDSGKKYIEFKFDVTTAFDRASNATIDFNIALPEAGSYSALNSVKSVTYNDCSGGAAGQVAIKMGATASTSKSNPQNYWETAGAGRLMFNYGSNMGSTNNSSGYKTADSTFYYYAASTGQKWMFQTYIAGVNKVRVAFRAAGTIKSSKATITNFYYNTEYFASPGSNAVSFGDVNANQAGYSSGEDGYIEFTVPEMAANSYGAFVTADGNMKVYGVVLYTENAGGGGSVATNPSWSDSKTDGFTVNKSQGDANFTYTISTTTNTLGAITYSSSNPSVAAVDPVTGEVTITATGESAQSTVITATLARSGCYQGATRTYTINVTGLSCSDVAGTISTEDLGCEGIKMTLSGYTEGASIQWYKDGETIADDGGEANVYTATSAGRYYAVTHKDCNRTSNTIEIADKSVSATREISKWYIKNGRPTPDIKLWTLGKGTHLTSVAWSTDNGTGLTGAEDIYERDGAVWLTGRQPNTNSGEDVSYTLTLTVNNGCSEDTTFSDASQKITIVHQKNTDKHVLAFVVNGTAKGDFTEGITAAQTTSVGLYNAIAAQFDVQATNIYATDDEKKLKEYYSQYDILCITDYPNTQTKGANSKSYVDAIGALIDIRPILTMEAFVSALPNWKLKGVSGNPKSPSTRQYTMLLQCKDHEIFSGTTLTKVGEGEDAMYRVTMVDKNQEEYKTLDANYGDGEHKANEGYQYGKKPALQGFTYTEEMSDNDMLPLGLIDDGAGNDLQVGIERQKEMSARMMVLGINSYAMERLDGDGEAIVINALKYLMKKSAEDISDCSVYFDGSDETDSTSWDNELNWGPSYASLPLPHQEVRILKECVVKDGVVARASGIKIIPRGRINHDTDDASGSLTIEPGGALIVDGKVRAAVAPNYFTAIQTTPADLYIAANETKGNGTLIFDNEDGETQATVGYYSKANTNENDEWNWQYMAVPFNDNSSAHRNFYDSYLYRWAEDCSGWEEVPNQGSVYPWLGYTITQVGQKMYYMDGTLVETTEQTFSIPAGKNLVVGNSWTAPIQVKQFEDADFAGMSKNIYLFNTGYDPNGEGAFDKADGRYEAGTYVTVPIHASPYTGDSLISSLQAFTVYATGGGGGGTFTLNYDRHIRPARTTDNLSAGPMHAPKRGGAIDNKPAVLKVWASGSRYDDRLVVLERGDFSTGLDEGWDGNKRVAGNSSPLIFAVTDNGREAVSAIPTMEGTLIGFWAGEDNEYTLHFEYDEEDELYLLDLDNNTYTPVNSNSTYVFTVPDKKAHNRFILTRNAPNPVATGVEETQANEKPEAKAIKFLKDEKVFIFVNGKLYDATGKIVK